MKVRDRATGPFQHQLDVDNVSSGKGVQAIGIGSSKARLSLP